MHDVGTGKDFITWLLQYGVGLATTHGAAADIQDEFYTGTRAVPVA